jgi:hypothetical protein
MFGFCYLCKFAANIHIIFDKCKKQSKKRRILVKQIKNTNNFGDFESFSYLYIFICLIHEIR